MIDFVDSFCLKGAGQYTAFTQSGSIMLSLKEHQELFDSSFSPSISLAPPSQSSRSLSFGYIKVKEIALSRVSLGGLRLLGEREEFFGCRISWKGVPMEGAVMDGIQLLVQITQFHSFSTFYTFRSSEIFQFCMNSFFLASNFSRKQLISLSMLL